MRYTLLAPWAMYSPTTPQKVGFWERASSTHSFVQWPKTTAQTSAISQVVSFSFFALNYAVTTSAPAGGVVDVTFLNGVAGGNSVTDGFYVPSASNKPLWQALSAGGIGALGKATGATSATVGNAFTTCQTDPGGFFDIGLNVTSTGSATPKPVTMYVDFVSPGP